MFGNALFQGGGAQFEAHDPERREHARHRVKLRVMVAVGGAILNGRAEDLSPGGAGLRLEEKLAEGVNITVRFLTPHLQKFDCIDVNARVQYLTLTSGSPPYRTGVRFVGVTTEMKRRIAALIGE